MITSYFVRVAINGVRFDYHVRPDYRTDCRLVRRTTTLGGVDLPAGSCVSMPVSLPKSRESKVAILSLSP
jgi:hypothetical protein